jgi:hypothetical protein
MNKDLEYECKAIGKIAHEVISIEYKDKGYVDDKGVNCLKSLSSTTFTLGLSSSDCSNTTQSPT